MLLTGVLFCMATEPAVITSVCSEPAFIRNRQPAPFFVSVVPDKAAFILKSALLLSEPPSSPTIFMGEACSTASVVWSVAPFSMVKRSALVVMPPRPPVAEYWLDSFLTFVVPPSRWLPPV